MAGAATVPEGVDPAAFHRAEGWGAPVPPDPTDFPTDLSDVRARFPHVDRFLNDHPDGKHVVYRSHLDPAERVDTPLLLYPVGEPVFVAITPDPSTGRLYHALEPTLDEDGARAVKAARSVVFRHALHLQTPRNRMDLAARIIEIFDRYVKVGPKLRIPTEEAADVQRSEDTLEVADAPKGPLADLRALVQNVNRHIAPFRAITMPAEMRSAVRYHLLRDLVGGGPIEPLLRDPYIEDAQGVGPDDHFVIHEHFGMIPTTIHFRDALHVDEFLENLAQRAGRPVSETSPIVDATLDDGSRLNLVHSNVISRRGPSYSIRRVATEPVPITRLIRWGTLDPHIAAYLWLCLENGMSVFICGDAACGKTTTLNAVLRFVDPKHKIYTAEDTPEVQPPHPVWQRLVTRETGPEDGRVGMFDLLKAALRSRPNYIAVGEIRGAEGAVAFQAMQTGHPVVATFHAASVQKMVQRLTSDPIHVPLTFIDNLNVAVIQKALRVDGRLIRRITDLAEIEGFSELDGGVMTRPVFTYDPQQDHHSFRGRNNSHILEKRIAETLGYPDPRQIYVDLDERAQVLRELVDAGVDDADTVDVAVETYGQTGITGVRRMIAERAAREAEERQQARQERQQALARPEATA